MNFDVNGLYGRFDIEKRELVWKYKYKSKIEKEKVTSKLKLCEG